MTAAIVTLTIKPEKEADFRAIIGAMIADVRANEPGTLVYHLNRDAESGRYRMFEVYASAEAAAVHAGRDSIRASARAIGPCLAEPVAIERLEAVI